MESLRYSTIYGSDNTWAIPRRNQSVVVAPAGINISLDETTVPGVNGIETLLFDPTAESNTIVVAGVESGSTVGLQIAQWGLDTYSYPSYIGDKLRVIVLGNAVTVTGIGFFNRGSSPETVGNATYYTCIDFTYMGDLLGSSIGENGGWAVTSVYCDGVEYTDN